jgi:hypothetical protein
MNQTSIISEPRRACASRVIADTPTGLRHISPAVCRKSQPIGQGDVRDMDVRQPAAAYDRFPRSRAGTSRSLGALSGGLCRPGR